MKKLLSILLCAVLVFAFAACGTPAKTPAETTAAPTVEAESARALKALLDPLATGDFADTDVLEGSAFANEDEMMLNGIFGKFAYTIGEAVENGDTATVKATITMVDMGGLFAAYLTEAMAHANDADWDADGSEFSKMAAADDAETKDFAVEVKMEKADGKWVVAKEGNDALYNALTGGLLDSLGGLEDMLGE